MITAYYSNSNQRKYKDIAIPIRYQLYKIPIMYHYKKKNMTKILTM